MVTSAPVPADQAVRDRVINELDTSFFIEAGAGSGKTSVIVARVVHCVRSGVPLPQIVAITFTEKAAAELRERIREELARAQLPHALREVDAAPIQTIHAFCANILREHALDASLHPNFRVLDQLQADLRFARSWRAWLSSDDAPQATLQRALELGLELGDLQAAAEQLAAHRDLRGAVAERVRSESDTPPDDLPADLPSDPPDDQVERDALLAALVGAIRQFVDSDAAQRRREGVFSYDDLLLETRDLLARSSGVRMELRERYRAILIDEFQDTDPLQAQIALLLSADPDTDDWTLARPGPGRLVISGDPKQAIYRFRRADIDIYEQVRERFREADAEAEVVQLSVNFRARPQLCHWYNRVLARVIESDERYPLAQARWATTDPYRTERGAAVAVIDSQEQFRRVGEARESEARLMANLIMHMRDGASSLGQLSLAGATRLPQFRDMALLIRTRTAADVYTNALDHAGIPYHFDSGQGFYQRAEIRALAYLLQALDDPTDSVSAIATLKSPLAAASDEDLFQLQAELGDQPILLDAEVLPEGYAGRLRAPVEALSVLRGELPGLGLPELIEHVIRRSGLLLAQALDGRPAQTSQRQANLRSLVLRAANFADEREDSLRPFVRWLSQRGLRNLPESESATTEADDDAVRILTIHQAKGLEFPIVIMPKLQDRPGAAQRPQFIVDRAREQLELRLGGDRGQAVFQSSGFAAVQHRERAYVDAESRRMLYVAATRARDWLILSSFPADSVADRESFYSYLEDAAPHWLQPDTDPDVVALGADRFDAVPPRPANVLIPPLSSLREQWRARHQAALEGGAEQIATATPSSLHRVEFSDSAEDEPQAWNPLEFGSAVHEALEACDFGDRELTRRRAIRICQRYRLPPQPLLEQLERALDSDLMQRAARAQQLHRELPLTTIEQSANGATLITEGIADLLFLDANGWVLVDYKSDPELPPERRDAYFQQVERYAAMLAKAGIEVTESYLLLTSTGEAIAVSPSEDAITDH